MSYEVTYYTQVKQLVEAKSKKGAKEVILNTPFRYLAQQIKYPVSILIGDPKKIKESNAK